MQINICLEFIFVCSIYNLMNSETQEKVRAFIAIELSESKTLQNILEAQTKLQAKLGPLKLVDMKIMHLTLCFYGDITIEQAERIYKEIIQPANREFFSTALESRVKGVGKFGKTVFFVHIEKYLDVLQKVVEFIIEKNEILKVHFDNKEFNPHLTIARSKPNRSSPKNFVQLWNEFEHIYKDFDFGPFVLNKIHLKKSTLTPQGPIYEDLEF